MNEIVAAGVAYNNGCCNNGWTSTGAVLVLFILLVIIAKAFSC